MIGGDVKTSIRTHEGRLALVTGAGQGIGQAIALALAERGAQVIATDLAPPDETVNKIGPSAHAFQLDVTQEEDWRSIALESRGVGEADIVVNNSLAFGGYNAVALFARPGVLPPPIEPPTASGKSHSSARFAP